MTATLLMAKSTPPVIPNAGDVRMFVNNDGTWCSEDEFGVITVYASTASVPTAPKAGVVSGPLFAGSPKTYDVAFDTPFPDNNYAVTITGADNRNWTTEGTTTSAGFTINANAGQALIGQVYWTANYRGS